MSPLRRLVRYARPHRRSVWAASVASVLNKTFDLAPPILIGLAVDVVVEKEDSFIASLGIETVIAQLWALAGVTFVIWALESLFEYALGVWWRNLAQLMQHQLRIDAYSHTQELEMRFFESQSSGELMAILNDDVNQLERFLDHGANDFLQVATTVVLVGGAFFIIAPQVAWLAFLPLPVVIWGSFAFQKRIAPRYADVRNEAGMINSQLINHIGGMSTIKSFTAQERQAARIAEGSSRYRLANRRAIRLSSAFSPLIRMAIVVGFTATLVLGGHLVSEERLGVGAFAVMVFLTQRLLWPLTRLGETFDLYQRAMASTKRILDLLDRPAQITDGTTHIAPGEVPAEMSLEGVTFAYDEGFPVLRDLTMEIREGETTAIVGPTGSGKTSVIKLLLRFYDVDEGRVVFGGHDVRDLRLNDLRHAIGFVSQDVFLFHGTVLENIAFGRPDATLDEIVDASKIAEAHEFILELPQGYETVVGERGQKLSGGQRQRVSIARAVLKDPAILILDEATSAVDNETEAAIQRSLEKISQGRTTISIAHRLSTVRNAERIYVLDRGELVESGTHDELASGDGVYASLWRVQTGLAVEHHRPGAGT